MLTAPDVANGPSGAVRVSVFASNYRCFSAEAPAEITLGPGLTAIVGANNAGKSAVLRMFWELRGIFEVLGGTPPRPKEWVERTTAFSTPTEDVEQIFHDGGSGDLRLTISVADADPEREALGGLISVPRGTNTFRLTLVRNGVEVSEVPHWSDWQPLDANGNRLGDIGPLLEAFKALARVRVIGPRRTAISQATTFDFDGITGSNLVSRWRSMKGGTKAARAAARLAERRLGELFGMDGLSINPSENGQELIVTYGDQSYQVDELGSGLGHFAVVLLTLGAYGEISWVLIDEPENGLHPTLQVDFLRVVETLAGEGVVFATHNYGLARRCADDILLITRESASRRSVLAEAGSVPSLAEFLGEMGYSGYRDLGFERLLLVEGPVDTRVVEEFKRIMKLRGNVLILPLGGSDSINTNAHVHLAEISRICPEIFALIDSERSSAKSPLSKERKAFVAACKALNIDCHVLKRRSTESYLSARAIKEVLGPSKPGPGEFDKATADVKSNQVKIARLMTEDEIAGTDVGLFLRKVFAA